MPSKAPARRRTARAVDDPVALPVLTKVVRPVAARLVRMESLLLEMRYEQDVQLKRIAALQIQLEAAVAGFSRAKRR